MVLIVVTSVFPPQMGSDVQKKYEESQKKYPLPAFIKQELLGLRWIREGIKAVAIYEVKKGKVADALNFVYRYESEFTGIAGYSNEIETLLSIKETPSLRTR